MKTVLCSYNPASGWKVVGEGDANPKIRVVEVNGTKLLSIPVAQAVRRGAFCRPVKLVGDWLKQQEAQRRGVKWQPEIRHRASRPNFNLAALFDPSPPKDLDQLLAETAKQIRAIDDLIKARTQIQKQRDVRT